MKTTHGIAIAVGGLLLSAAPLFAQARPLPVQPKPTHAQQGAVGPQAPPAPKEVNLPRPYNDGSYNRYNRGTRRALEYTAQMEVDGRVYANFGSGLTLVSQACTAAQLGLPEPTPTGTVVQPQVLQPVPGVQSSTAQAITTYPGNPTSATAGGSRINACWTRDAAGKLIVYRFN